ncbi:hypothetical protein [Kingella oralis]|uniref:hypothetical protein n=1 Tax=Kingella oralis TaxID=505 RepID=UPI002D7FEA5F|nr:hypothetical protein [Kingella oralis]
MPAKIPTPTANKLTAPSLNAGAITGSLKTIPQAVRRLKMPRQLQVGHRRPTDRVLQKFQPTKGSLKNKYTRFQAASYPHPKHNKQQSIANTPTITPRYKASMFQHTAS